MRYFQKMYIKDIFIYHRPDSSGAIPVITFTSVTVQGGGTLVIETEGNGMKLVGTDFTIQSGGTVEADNLHVEANTLTVEDSAYIKADKLVSLKHNFFTSKDVTFAEVMLNLIKYDTSLITLIQKSNLY